LAVVEMPGIAVPEVPTAVFAAEDAAALSAMPGLPQADSRLQKLMFNAALQADHTIVVDDTSADARLREVSGWCGANGLYSLAAIPIRRSGSLVGVLVLGSRVRSAFAGEATPLLSELGADFVRTRQLGPGAGASFSAAGCTSPQGCRRSQSGEDRVSGSDEP
jgi:hypothetical protein